MNCFYSLHNFINFTGEIMKNFLIFSVIILSSIANALEQKNPIDACNRINDYSYRSACLTAVTSNSTDWLAAGACDRIESARLTMACLTLISGQTYNSSSVYACDSYTGARQTISCLTTIGYSSESPKNSSEINILSNKE